MGERLESLDWRAPPTPEGVAARLPHPPEDQVVAVIAVAGPGVVLPLAVLAAAIAKIVAQRVTPGAHVPMLGGVAQVMARGTILRAAVTQGRG